MLITDNDRFLAIIEATCFWLGYQFKIGRSKLIHEASLRYPIADTLTSKWTSMDMLGLEKSHLIFQRRSIDLVTYRSIPPDDEEDGAQLIEAFEFKLAKSGTGREKSAEHQRVFDDVARLAYLHQHHQKTGYFLMCGKFDDFKTFFAGQQQPVSIQGGQNTAPVRHNSGQPTTDQWQPKGLYANWFSFEPGETKTYTFHKNDAEDWGLFVFQENYKIKKNSTFAFTDRLKIKTTCMAIVGASSQNRTHAAGIWKIESDESKS